MREFIDTPSFTTKSIDEIIEQLKEYKKKYGGDTVFESGVIRDCDHFNNSVYKAYQGFYINKDQPQN